MRIPLICLLFFAASCSRPGTKNPAKVPDAVNPAAVSDANVKIAKELYARFNRHDWTGMASLYANPAVFKDPSFGQDTVLQTRHDIAGKYAMLEKYSPNIRDSIVAIYPSGENHVVVEFISSGGEGAGKWTLPICTIFTFKDGKISHDFTYYDNQSSSE